MLDMFELSLAWIIDCLNSYNLRFSYLFKKSHRISRLSPMRPVLGWVLLGNASLCKEDLGRNVGNENFRLD